ncbi:MAG: hypothetical protein LC793_24745, partial [Thermomicrobia bacterium]|nr:hypothetical protein [Thermomicrobia bacterium]
LVAGFGGASACIGATTVAGAMVALLVGNRLFLTTDAGGVVRAGALMLGVAATIRLVFAPLCRRAGMATTARDLRWLALIAGATLALRFVGVLHPNIVIVHTGVLRPLEGQNPATLPARYAILLPNGKTDTPPDAVIAALPWAKALERVPGNSPAGAGGVPAFIEYRTPGQ